MENINKEIIQRNHIEIMESKNAMMNKTFTEGVQQQIWAGKKGSQQTWKYVNWDDQVLGTEMQKEVRKKEK